MLCCAVLSHSVTLFETPWIVARQTSLSMEILQARILEWVAMPPSRGSSQPRDRTPTLQVDCLPFEPPEKPKKTGVGSLSYSRNLPDSGIEPGFPALQVDS